MATDDTVKHRCTAMFSVGLDAKPVRTGNLRTSPTRQPTWGLAAAMVAVGAMWFAPACTDDTSVSASQTSDVASGVGDTTATSDSILFDSFDIEIPDHRIDVVSPADGDSTLTDAGTADAGQDTAEPDDLGAPSGDVTDSSELEDSGDLESPPPCPPATPCNDDNPCTMDDRCQADGMSCAGIPYECDDGLGCTAQLCDGDGGCAVSIAEFACVIDGQCVLFGTPDPNKACHACIPENSQVMYSADNTAVCDDGDPCTLTLCQDGSCNLVGPAVCDDANPCTADSCDPETGCVYSNVTSACDDGSACTKDDVCTGGACVGQAIQCNDGIPCTVDACEPTTGCHNNPIDQKCDDAVACTVHVCVPDFGCIGTTVVALCNDGDPCTTDVCSSTMGCMHTDIVGCQPPEPCVDATECDDGIACTIDSCDVQKGCLHIASAEKCDDLDPCTTQSCSVPDGGCVTAPASGAPCDDGDPCTDTAQCEVGMCVGSGNVCGCKPTIPTTAQKLVSLQIGSAGTPGEGLDVDNDPKTCAPQGACSGGIDNALSFIAGLANTSLVEAVTSGNLIFMLDYLPTPGDTTPQILSLLTGEISETTPGCDPMTTGCAFLVSPASYDADTCNPMISFDNVVLTNTVVTGGGKNSQIQISIPLGDTAQLDLTLYGAKLAATATFSGGKLQTMSGIIGGALPKQTLLDAVAAVPEGSLPLPKTTVLALLETAIVEDVDIDGDKIPDGASMALKFSSIAAPVVGLSE